MDRMDRYNLEYVRRFVSGVLASGQDNICHRIFDTFSHKNVDIDLLTADDVSVISGVMTTIDSELEMKKRLVEFQKEYANLIRSRNSSNERILRVSESQNKKTRSLHFRKEEQLVESSRRSGEKSFTFKSGRQREELEKEYNILRQLANADKESEKNCRRCGQMN